MSDQRANSADDDFDEIDDLAETTPETTPPTTSAPAAQAPLPEPGADAFEVPADASSLSIGTTFKVGEYAPILTHSGALKMVDSAVAPIVAIARGYETVVRETLRDAAVKYNLGTMSSKHGRQLGENVGAHDAMMMPWYSPDAVRTAEHRRAESADPSTWIPAYSSLQVRPSEHSGRTSKEGKRLKYDIFSGQVSTIGIHPATPSSWVSGAPTFFITEGAIKGDAALTGLLRYAGSPRPICGCSRTRTGPTPWPGCTT